MFLRRTCFIGLLLIGTGCATRSYNSTLSDGKAVYLPSLNSDAILDQSQLEKVSAQAEAGDVHSITKLAEHFALSGNPKKSFEIIRDALFKGHNEFAYGYGTALFQCGRNKTEVDLGLSFMTFGAGLDPKGSPMELASALLAGAFGSGDFGVEKNPEVASFWFDKYVNKEFSEDQKEEIFKTFMSHKPIRADRERCQQLYGL